MVNSQIGHASYSASQINRLPWCKFLFQPYVYSIYAVTSVQVAGLELSELPVASPLIHSSLRRLANWQDNFKMQLDCRQAPAEYIPGCFVENTQGPAIHKYRFLL